jgi:VanZ family protein
VTSRRIAFGLVLLSVGVVLALTLTPSFGDPPEPHSLLCVWCNGRALADMLLNVGLFVPVGAALANWQRIKLRSVLAAVVLTVGIELAQFVIPGRDPNLSDVLTNTLGAVIGVLLVTMSARWLNPSPLWRGVLAAGGSALAVTVLVVGSWLFAPAFQDGVYYGQWTADLHYLEWYRGQVLKSQVGDIPVRSRIIRRTDEVRELLFQGARIQVEAVSGPPATALAPIFSIYDDREREVLLVGTDRNDAVLRYRMRAASFRLDQPDLRFADSFAEIRAGQALRLEVARAGHSYCFTVNEARSCRVGLRAADTWGLLFFVSSVPGWARTLLGVLWLCGLFFAAGFWLERKSEVAVAGVFAVAALALIPTFAFVKASSGLDYAAALCGVLLGFGARRVLQWWRPLRAGGASDAGSDNTSASARTHLSTRS